MSGIAPIAVSIPDGCKLSGFSRSRLYEKIQSGEIEVKKDGRKTLVLYDSLRRCVENLPSGSKAA